MRYLSLFSGIEAASAAWAPLGWECVGVSDIEPFPCSVLAQRHPGVPNLGDITKITESDIAMLGGIDLVVFGSPCQDLSVAGKRKGLDGARSGLFFAAMQIIEWARVWGDCRFALWENVPGAFSSNAGADFGVVVGQMAGHDSAEIPPKGWGTEGAIVGPQGMVEWSVLDAQWFGVAQRRRRVFALADFGDWANRPPILLEPESLRGDSAPSREAGQSFTHAVAPCLTSSGRGVERGGDTRGQDPVVACLGLQRSVLEPVICAATGQAGAEITTGYSPTLNCNHEAPYVAYAFNSNAQPDEMKFDPLLSAPLTCSPYSAVACVTGQITHTLKAEGFDASEDGTGRGTPIVPVAFDTTQITSKVNRSNPLPGDPCHPLTAGGHPPAVAYAIQGGALRTNPLSGPDGAGVQSHIAYTLESRAEVQAVAYSTKLHNTQSNQAGKIYEEYTTALDLSSPPPALLTAMQVRRLTPRECERLQAFPDDHTLITVRGKPAADGPRYKALGNSMCVNVMAWIGKQIDYTVTFY